jgi:DNA-binding LacI/PurR family transcriptional regulator
VDVARSARVSQSTVSRVFSGKGNVSLKTADRVTAAARALGYRPNAIARSLTSQRTNIVALVSVRSTHTFYSSIVNGALGRLSRAGRQVLFFQTGFDTGFEDIFQQVLQYKVDALLIVSAAVSSEITRECERAGLPIVVFNRIIRSPGVFSLCSDNPRAGRDVADYLAGRGYRSFAYIGSARRLPDISRDREKGFAGRAAELGIEMLSVSGDYSYESGRAAMRSILTEGRKVDAVFASNDLMAMGAMDEARREFGLSIPGDVAVIGFDAIEEGSWKAYSLTTVEQRIDEMLDAACSYLIERLDGQDTGKNGEPRLFPCRIVERGTA